MPKINYNPSAVIRANKIKKTIEKIDGIKSTKEKEKIKIPWFCPRCKKLTHPRDDIYLLEHNCCMDCWIYEDMMNRITEKSTNE